MYSMADEATLTALRAGTNEWNKFVLQFTKEFPDRPFDFTDVDLLAVNFASIEFGRRAQFDGSHFHSVEFANTRFDQGASFVGSTFHGVTTIISAREMGDISFDQARFEGPVEIRAVAGARTVRFVAAQLLEGITARGHSTANPLQLSGLSFQQAAIHGSIIFENCTFGQADFRSSRLALPLAGMTDNICAASFKNCTFQLGATFEGARFEHGASFENAKFLGSSSFRGTVFSQAPNFHEATLHQGTLFSSKDEFPSLFLDLKSRGAAEAYRTLKLAMNKRHALNEELGFFLLEMRATALRLPRWRRVPYVLYDWMSMYGQSVQRPLWWFVGVHLVFALAYTLLQGERWEVIDSGLTSLTLYGAIPFAAALRWPEVSGSGNQLAFPPDRLVLVQVAIVFQSILSAVLLFLVGLGLRNMFKVR
jgi:uncharacterized protein YjbI with pentapeptide repeats